MWPSIPLCCACLLGSFVHEFVLIVPSGLTTLSTLNVTGTTSLVGTTTIDNLTFNDNIIGTSSNADLNLTPGGTGNIGETGASGGEWGADGGDTSNTGDGGDAGAAIFPSGITVTGTINTNTIKGSY